MARIGIDYTAAAWQGAGIGRYTRELVRATLEQGGAHEYVLFFAAGGLDRTSAYVEELRRLCRAHPNVTARPIPLSPRRLTQLWQRLRLPLPVELFTGRLDLLHAPDFVLPPTRARTLLTIHDLSFLVHPQTHLPSMVRYLSGAVPRSLRRADLVVADSLATRDDLARLLGVDAGRVRVVYPGVGPQFRPLDPRACEPVRARLGLPERFLLFVSTISPRKNLVGLLEAYAPVARGRPDVDLVVIGQRGWLYEEVFAAVERLGLGPRVHLPGFVHDKDLPAVYNLALASVYPSLYEGFGLPALEALACGTPLVTADNSSLPEVAGDAALLVDATDTAALARAIQRLIDDAELRARLSAAGPAQAGRFRWDQAARQILECYRAVIPGAPGAPHEE
jgi:glycosyltransferase involved in cell wall biosynthesis